MIEINPYVNLAFWYKTDLVATDAKQHLSNLEAMQVAIAESTLVPDTVKRFHKTFDRIRLSLPELTGYMVHMTYSLSSGAIEIPTDNQFLVRWGDWEESRIGFNDKGKHHYLAISLNSTDEDLEALAWKILALLGIEGP